MTPRPTPGPTGPTTAPATVAASTPASGATPALASSAAEEEIDWSRVDTAMEYFSQFDVLDLASLVIDKAITKGPKNVYNEAGTVRFQLSKAKAMYGDLEKNICGESLAAKLAKIERQEKINAKKRWISSAP